jgi:DNA processing protein
LETSLSIFSVMFLMPSSMRPSAVPWPITSSASAGCHRLLREYDALCVTTADDLAELAPLPEPAFDADAERTEPPNVEEAGARGRRPAADPTGTRIRLLHALSARSPRSAEKIAALSGVRRSPSTALCVSAQEGGCVHRDSRCRPPLA